MGGVSDHLCGDRPAMNDRPGCLPSRLAARRLPTLLAPRTASRRGMAPIVGSSKVAEIAPACPGAAERTVGKPLSRLVTHLSATPQALSTGQ